jgi:predicted nucleic acid-binding protein
LECAVTAKAAFMVTGGSDLLDIGRYEGIEILQVAEFLIRVGDQEQL